jgi:hypothetical protein
LRSFVREALVKKILVVVAVVALTSVGAFAQSSSVPTVPGGGDGSPVPEPVTLALLAAGTVGVGVRAWRQKKSRQ